MLPISCGAHEHCSKHGTGSIKEGPIVCLSFRWNKHLLGICIQGPPPLTFLSDTWLVLTHVVLINLQVWIKYQYSKLVNKGVHLPFTFKCIKSFMLIKSREEPFNPPPPTPPPTPTPHPTPHHPTHHHHHHPLAKFTSDEWHSILWWLDDGIKPSPELTKISDTMWRYISGLLSFGVFFDGNTNKQ